MKKPMSRIVESFVRLNPHVAKCLRAGLVNHCSLARLICQNEKSEQIPAAQMAIGRLSKRINKNEGLDKKIEKQLKKARLITRSNISLVILDNTSVTGKVTKLERLISEIDDEITIVHGYKKIILIIGSEHIKKAKLIFSGQITKTINGLAKIQLLIGESAMFTPGFSAYVLSLIASQNINVLEELTCAGEHILLVNDLDLETALSALRHF
jgi:hypothetical protein